MMRRDRFFHGMLPSAIGMHQEVDMSPSASEYPPGLALAIQTTPEELDAQVRLMAALKMFELGKLSSGKAAELAGMSRVEFLDQCGRYRVSIFNYSPDELEAELQSDLDAARHASRRSSQQES
jgi:predicted HTH domain antitoxin